MGAGAAGTLYTIGYQERSVAEFIAILKRAGIDVLIDVRDNASSRKPGFSKGSLQQALAKAGIDYVHAQFAGTPKWLRGNADSHAQILEWYAWYLKEFDEIVPAFDALVAEHAAAGERACVFCLERDPAECHRSILAERWRKRGRGRGRRQVVHLGTA